MRHSLALVSAGTAAIGGSVFLFPHSDLEIVVLGVGVALLATGAWLAGLQGWRDDKARVWSSAAAIGVVATVFALNGTEVLDRPLFSFSFLVALVLAAAALALPADRRQWFVALWLMSVVVVGAAAFSTLDVVADIDVVDLHEQAATALANGQNPYTTGSVSVVESRPGTGQELIEEYTYPPVVLVLYSAGSWITGDSRAAGAAAVTLSVLLIGLIGVFGRDRENQTFRLALASLAIVVSNPSTFFVVVNGLTEAVTLPLFIVAAATWRRYPTASAVCLGIALGSKQYLVLALPLLFVLGDRLSQRRTVIAGGAAFLTALPFLLWDARGFVDGVIIHHLTRDARFDSATLAGAGIIVPTVLAVSFALAVGVAIAWRRSGAGVAIFAVASSVAVFTYFAIRGFGNTWYLVVGLVAVALLVGADRDSPARRRTAPSSGAVATSAD